MTQCQISLYPLGNSNFRKIISECIKVLDKEDISYTVTSTSTLIKGEEDKVFEAVKKLFMAAKEMNPENIMLAVYSTACN